MLEQDSISSREKSAAQPNRADDKLNLLSLTDSHEGRSNKSESRTNGSTPRRNDPMRAVRPGQAQDNPQHLPQLDIVNGVPAPKLGSGTYYEGLDSQHQAREFELHIPKGYDGKSPLPVVYMMHGFTENMNMMREYSQMDKLADEKGFAVVYLQAEKQPVSVWGVPGAVDPIPDERSWNMDHGTLTPKDPKYDDLAYIQRVKNIVESETNIDKSREYLAGFSEGGQAASYIAQKMPHTFAGIASVHGTMIDSDPLPTNSDSTAFISILGDNDNILPMNGGRNFFDLPPEYARTSEPLKQALAWAAANDTKKMKAEVVDNSMITHFDGGKKPVEQIVRFKHDSPDGPRGGSHAWDGGNNGYAGEPNPDWIQMISRHNRQSDPDFDASRTVIDFLFRNRLD